MPQHAVNPPSGNSLAYTNIIDIRYFSITLREPTKIFPSKSPEGYSLAAECSRKFIMIVAMHFHVVKIVSERKY